MNTESPSIDMKTEILALWEHIHRNQRLFWSSTNAPDYAEWAGRMCHSLGNGKFSEVICFTPYGLQCFTSPRRLNQDAFHREMIKLGLAVSDGVDGLTLVRVHSVRLRCYCYSIPKTRTYLGDAVPRNFKQIAYRRYTPV